MRTHALRRAPAWAALVSLVAGMLVALTPGAASAADAGDFDPGNIISDEVFFDSSTMTPAQIQQFLDIKGAACVAGEQPCLRTYRAASSTRVAEAGLCSGYTGLPSESAAEMIANVAKACGVNPRVLIVLLEKENSLVTKTRPTTRNYQAATGYACPDTAPCDAQYYGLFNQLYMAARQYQNYAANPTRYSYRAGRTNTIYWHPNAACGTSQVYIANQATAGLYNYTPYRPNAAALANLYGTGDSCSSYGNRNFWRLFSDWFGSTQSGTYLLRTEANPTVYLVTSTQKFAIPSMTVLAALSPLGSVGYVSQQYLDRRTTGPTLKRSLLGPDGTVYFFDAGMKLPFGSCAQVAAYGMSCGDAVPIEAGQVAALPTGPAMTSYYRTTTGRGYWIENGTRREVADPASLTAAGLPTASVTLLDSGISYLPLGVPVVRTNVVATARDSGAAVLSTSGGFAPLPSALATTGGIAGLPRVQLDAASIALLPTASPVAPLMTDPVSGRTYLLTAAGRIAVDDPGALPATVAAAPPGVLGVIPEGAAAPAGPLFVKGAGAGTVYLLRSGALRAFGSWTDLVGVAGTGEPAIHVLATEALGAFPAGPLQVMPGTMSIALAGGTVYLTDGLDGRIAVPSFNVTNELGLSRVVRLPDTDLNGYAIRTGLLSNAVRCGDANYLGLGGSLTPVPDTVAAEYALTYTQLDASTCAALPRAANPLGRFVRTPNGTIYVMQAGTKRPIGSYTTYVAAGGTAANTTAMSDWAAGRFPTGELFRL